MWNPVIETKGRQRVEALDSLMIVGIRPCRGCHLIISRSCRRAIEFGELRLSGKNFSVLSTELSLLTVLLDLRLPERWLRRMAAL